MKLFCFGLGYTATHLISKLSPTSWQYSGTRKNSHIIFDGQNPIDNISDYLKNVTHMLISIPPNQELIDNVIHYHLNDIKAVSSLKWVGYLSATSVYGDLDGKWADETSDTNPTEKRGKLRLKAENLWCTSNLPIHIFRLGGIYGPERNQISAVKSGNVQKINKPSHSFSRIHVDDICSALLHSMENPSPGSIYNLVDDQPSSAADVIDFICDQLGKKRLDGVDFDKAVISPALKSFYADNKRVSNAITKKALNWKPKYPSYQDGYLDILSKLD